jgi:hypothetical protein
MASAYPQEFEGYVSLTGHQPVGLKIGCPVKGKDNFFGKSMSTSIYNVKVDS